MSPNVRFVLLTAFFVVLGGGLWLAFEQRPDETIPIPRADAPAEFTQQEPGPAAPEPSRPKSIQRTRGPV